MHAAPFGAFGQFGRAYDTPMIERCCFTRIGVAVTNLGGAGERQLELPFQPDRSEALDDALDEVRRRFGSSAVRRAVLLGRDPGLTVSLLPD